MPIAAVMWGLDAVDKFRGGAQAAGLADARADERISEFLGGPAVRAMNGLTRTHTLVAAGATTYYVVMHFLVTGTVAILLLRSGHESFRRHRDALIVIQSIGLAVFWTFPVAPPRMLPGYYDTIAANVPVFSHVLENHAADQFASFPSLHVAWALWVAVAVQPLLRRPAWRAAAWVYPALTTVDVLATANHYPLDVLAAPVVLAGGYAVTAALPVLGRRALLPGLAWLPRLAWLAWLAMLAWLPTMIRPVPRSRGWARARGRTGPARPARPAGAGAPVRARIAGPVRPAAYPRPVTAADQPGWLVSARRGAPETDTG